MPAPPPPHPNVLLVEGKDDLHVLLALLKHHNVPRWFEPLELGGASLVLSELSLEARLKQDADELEVRLLESGRQRVGIVLDADVSLASRWQSVRDRLQLLGYQRLPAQPDADGTVIEDVPERPLPRVGIWLMPDNQLPGELENFIRFSFPPMTSTGTTPERWSPGSRPTRAGSPTAIGSRRTCTPGWRGRRSRGSLTAWPSRPGTSTLTRRLLARW